MQIHFWKQIFIAVFMTVFVVLLNDNISGDEKIKITLNNSISKITEYRNASDFVDLNFEPSFRWQRDANCSRFSYRLGKNLNLTYLASYPRSGNTWMRYLVESATGLTTAGMSLYPKPMQFRQDMKYVMVKTHTTPFTQTNGIPNNIDAPVVLLFRRIDKLIFSFWSFKLRNMGIFKEAPEYTYKTEGFRSHVKQSIKNWKKMNEDCIKYCKNLLVIFYEDVVKDHLKELTKIVHFLGFLTDQHRFNCLKKFPDGAFKSNYQLNIEDPYTKDEKRQMVEAFEEVTKRLQERGVPIPHEYEDYISTKKSINSANAISSGKLNS